MRILHFISMGTEEQREQIWRLICDKGWVSATIGPGIDFYCPEHLYPLCLLIDPGLIRSSSAKDYII